MPYAIAEAYASRGAATVRFPVMPDDVYGDDEDRKDRFEDLQTQKSRSWVLWTVSDSP